MSADRGARRDARHGDTGGGTMDREGTLPGYQLFVGVDIAATTATVAWRGPSESAGRTITIEQSPQGLRRCSGGSSRWGTRQRTSWW